MCPEPGLPQVTEPGGDRRLGPRRASRDLLQGSPFLVRHEVGDKVTVLYDPHDPETVMIDNGGWNWDQPIFGVLGGLLLLGLAVALFRSRGGPSDR